MIALRAGRVLAADGERRDCHVVVDGPTIVDVTETPPAGARLVDLGDVDLIPGLIDLHCDAMSDRKELRSSTQGFVDGLLDLDAEAAAHGVTTNFLCLRLEEHEVDPDGPRAVAEALAELRDWREHLRVEHLLHLRIEIACDQLDGLALGDEPGLVGLVSYMDHAPGRGQFVEPEGWQSYYSRRAGDRPELGEELAQRRAALAGDTRLGEARRVAIARLAQWAGALLASHDDDDAATVAQATALGVGISEFPVTREAARLAHDARLGVVMGAPNARRGGSHMTGASAVDVLRDGNLDALASDYHPPTMLGAAYALAARGDCGWAQAVELVSTGPARIARLEDRGRIAPGLRADLVAVRARADRPFVRHAWCAGAPVAGGPDLRAAR